jgi:23S rRNA pseudouridine2605 synthase
MRPPRTPKKHSASSGRGRASRPGSRPPRPTGPADARRGRPKRRPPRARPEAAPDDRGERLQKVLAAAGLGSRRQCEELIQAGRVEVDRKVVTELGTRVDATGHEVRVDGVALRVGRRVYYAVNKPDGIISTSRDPSGRPRVIDLAPKSDARLFAVGRLDLHSEGLILLTNDGELANRLTHPRYGVRKIYRVVVAGVPEREVLAQLRRGIRLAEAFVRVPDVRLKSWQKKSAILEMALEEGRNREIRRVLAKAGHKVLRLTRIAVGPIRLGDLPSGHCRLLSRQEVQALREATGM